MFLKFVLIGIAFSLIIILLDIFYPKMKLKYKIYKERKDRDKKRKAFKDKMKQLEIK